MVLSVHKHQQLIFEGNISVTYNSYNMSNIWFYLQ